jgi:YfiH family protein
MLWYHVYMKKLNYKNIKIIISERLDGSMKFLGDFNDENVSENRRKFFKKFGVDLSEVVSAELEHGSNVSVVGRKDGGNFIEKTDGIITKEKDLFLTITVADCLPVFLYDKGGIGVGILHGGWSGVEDGIVEKGVEEFVDLTGCSRRDVFLKIGPAINRCCFEVDEKVLMKFKNFANAIEVVNDKNYIDLRKIVKQIALKEGLLGSNIETEDECTSCLSEKYFSFRRDKPEKIQAIVAGIGIVSKSKFKFQDAK